MPDLKPWKVPVLAFIIGAVVAGGLAAMVYTLRSENGPSKMDWILALAAPGFVLSLPINLLAGGAHGEYAKAWVFSIVPLNGIAYALVALVFRGIKKHRREPQNSK
jgi:hypothetical protein